MITENSLLRFYSFGIVTKDKEEGTWMVNVSPTEHLPYTEGPLKDRKETYDKPISSSNGKPITDKIESTGHLEAEWFPLGGDNQITPPDVCAGETIMLIKYGNSNKIYWMAIGVEHKLRKKETVCHMYGNTEKPLEEWTKQNTLWIEKCTRKKHVIIHTPDNEGEPATLEFKMDYGNGVITMSGDDKPGFTYDIKNNTITFKTKVVFEEEIKIKKKSIFSATAEFGAKILAKAGCIGCK